MAPELKPNHADIVEQVHVAQPPARTIDGALNFLLRVIARLQHDFPTERVGLLIKTAGENIVPYASTSVSASRIVYPDHDLLVKILSDVPTTNGPSWQPEEGIPNTGHHEGYLAVIQDTPGLPEVDRLALLESQVTDARNQIQLLFALHASLERVINRHDTRQYRGNLKRWGVTIGTVISDPVYEGEESK